MTAPTVADLPPVVDAAWLAFTSAVVAAFREYRDEPRNRRSSADVLHDHGVGEAGERLRTAFLEALATERAGAA